MAYPTICPSCREGRCTECQAAGWDLPADFADNPEYAELTGGAFCVCAHGEPESDFQKSVREQLADAELLQRPDVVAGIQEALADETVEMPD